MKTLALIPARSGSKGIPGKNTRDFCGKPLMAWAIDVGKATCDTTVVSTDGDRAAEIAMDAGVVIRRVGPPIHTDECVMLAVVQDTLRAVGGDFDVVVLLQPTQPLRTAEYVREAINWLEKTGADSVVSVVKIPEHYSPDFAMKISDGHLVPFNGRRPSRRQDTRTAYSCDGTVYATRREVIGAGSLFGNDCCPYIIPRSESANLDTEEDWKRAEMMMKERDNGDSKP